MQMYCLQRRLQNTNISVTSLHPGVVQTEIARDYNDVWWFRILKSIARVKGWWVLTVCACGVVDMYGACGCGIS